MTEVAGPGYFKASLSSKAKLITYGVGFGVGLGVPLALAAGFHFGLGQPLAWLLPILFALILALARAFRPLGYRISPNALEIHRPAGAKRFKTVRISSVHFPAESPPGAVFGICRVEGFYGAWGLYWNRAWGRFRVYVTNDANRVEIRLKDGMRIILSPDDPEAFVEKLQASIAHTD